MLVEHHIKYKEIHGVDETVWLTKGEHRKLHNRLRKEGKCKIPVDELRRISNKACGRTPKHIVTSRACARAYHRAHTLLRDSVTLIPNVQMKEHWYFTKSGSFRCDSCFCALHGKKLLYIDIQ